MTSVVIFIVIPTIIISIFFRVSEFIHIIDIGPGPVIVRMEVEMQEKTQTISNVVGTIEGTEDDRSWVLLGNHR